MRKPNEVELPLWMRKLPKDRRGYPVPYVALKDTDGKAHFTINNERVRQYALKKELCHICGNKLLKRRAMVGGAVSAFHQHGAYIDGPMHLECARYALQVCPFLANPSYVKRIDARTLNHDKMPEGLTGVMDPTMDPRKPVLYVLVVCVGQTYTYAPISMAIKYVKPRRPYVAVEYWQSGVLLDPAEGEAMAKRVLLEKVEQDFQAVEVR